MDLAEHTTAAGVQFVVPTQRLLMLDVTRLATLLCPYRDAVTRAELAGGQLYTSSLAELAPERVAIRRGPKQDAQTVARAPFARRVSIAVRHTYLNLTDIRSYGWMEPD